MARVSKREDVTADGVVYSVREMGALDKMRCFADLKDDKVSQVEAVALALSKSVYIGDERAFKDMEDAGSVSLDTFNALSEAFTRVNEGPKT